MMMAMAILCVLLHEAAHALTAENLGLRAREVVVKWYGIGVRRERGLPWQNLLVAAAGPVMSFLLAFILWGWAPDIAKANLALGILCVLQPNKKSDGQKMLTALRQMRWI
jgi:hypothetical protein